jgi:allantoate deiminase
VTFKGAAGHAGTVPMPGRRDAFSACAEFGLGLRGQALALPGTVATIGDLRIVDPASNVIPGLVNASVDLRAPTSEVLELLADAAATTAVAAASMHGCEVELVRDWCSDPVSMSVAVQEALLAEAQAAGAAAHTLPSGAGHDAGVMAAAGVETGMLFVRSRNGGVSHRPDELSDAADIGRAIDVLEGAIRRLA